MRALASEFQVLNDRVLYWSAFDPDVKSDLCSVAYKREGGLILIDPIPLEPEALEELKQHGEIRAVLATNENHQRASAAYCKQFQVPFCVPMLAAKKMEPRPNVYILPNELVYGMTPLSIPGANEGETAFFSPEGYLFIGDAILNLGQSGLQLLPDKYCADPRQNRESLKKFLDLPLPLTLMTFAHGTPLRQNIHDQLKTLLQ